MDARRFGSSVLKLHVQAIDPLVVPDCDGDTVCATHRFDLIEEAGKLEGGDALLHAPGAIVRQGLPKVCETARAS
jgi:hypothetical protein